MSTLIIVGNGPGEVAGWVLPVARAVRARAGGALRLIHVLPPSQFASGRELDLSRRSGLFDELVPPRRSLALALGRGALPLRLPAALLHLGGDLWISARLARRAGIPAFAYAETALVARRHRAFEEVFTPSPRVADVVRRAGVPSARIRVTGDPRLDTLPPRQAGGNRLRVGLLPGSRPHFFRVLLPLWMETALSLRRRCPDAEVTIPLTPLLPDALVDDVLDAWRTPARDASIALPRASSPEIIARSDLVVTVPGTTTMEAAAAPVTALVVVPLQHLHLAAAEGILEWLLRGRVWGWARRQVALANVRRHRFAALPNRLTGRAILPELIGRVTAEEVAARAEALLRDGAARAQIEAALAEALGPRGGAARIAERMLEAVDARRTGVEAVPATVG